MKIYIFVEKDGSISGTSLTPELNTVEVEVPKGHPLLLEFGKYSYIDGKLVEDHYHLLKELRLEKNEELNEACKKSILYGFSHEIDGEIYHFPFDMEAQLNFQSDKVLLENNQVDSIKWTVRNSNGKYIRVSITKDNLDELSLAVFNHKDRNLSKYRETLIPMVESAKTIEEIKNITWNNIES